VVKVHQSRSVFQSSVCLHDCHWRPFFGGSTLSTRLLVALRFLSLFLFTYFLLFLSPSLSFSFSLSLHSLVGDDVKRLDLHRWNLVKPGVLGYSVHKGLCPVQCNPHPMPLLLRCFLATIGLHTRLWRYSKCRHHSFSSIEADGVLRVYK
jgi:hypothetical protein